jgi:hypothetical protein
MLPQIAKGDANKVWIVPSELGEALKGIGGVLGAAVAPAASGSVGGTAGDERTPPPPRLPELDGGHRGPGQPAPGAAGGFAAS